MPFQIRNAACNLLLQLVFPFREVFEFLLFSFGPTFCIVINGFQNIVSVAFQLTVFGSLYFGSLATSSLSLAFSMTLRSQPFWRYNFK